MALRISVANKISRASIHFAVLTYKVVNLYANVPYLHNSSNKLGNYKLSNNDNVNRSKLIVINVGVGVQTDTATVNRFEIRNQPIKIVFVNSIHSNTSARTISENKTFRYTVLKYRQ